MSDTLVPVPSSFDRRTLRQEVNAKVQRFISGATTALPEDGEEKHNNPRALRQTISGLARSPEALYDINGDGNIPVGETAAVCFLGSQEVILLRIFYRTGDRTWQQYEYALCYQRRGRSSVRWTEARAFYRQLARRQSSTLLLDDIDMSKVRSSAQSLVDRFEARGRSFKPKGALLEGPEVESQIKGLRPVFRLGAEDARTATAGTYIGVCFVSEATGLNLRIYRLDSTGWLYATYVLDVSSSRPNSQHRGRRGNIIEYTWRNA